MMSTGETQSPEILRLLIKRTGRGKVIFPTLCIVAIAAGVFCMVSRNHGAWIVTAWLLATCLLLAYRHVRIRHYLALQVSQHPDLVFWAHASSRHGPCPDAEISESQLIVLHLRNGHQLEAGGLQAADTRILHSWLREKNPSIRLGQYDSALTSETGSHNQASHAIGAGAPQHER